MPTRHARGLTLVEVVVTILIVIALIAVILPILGALRPTKRSPISNTQVRGIHQAMVMYAQGNGGYFPGLMRNGTDAEVRVEDRFRLLLENNYFTGEYAISPSETLTAWTTGELLPSMYSYALPQLPRSGARRYEWRETLNTDAPAVGDRAKHDAEGRLSSVHTEPGDGWRGQVAYNDNHVVFEATHVLATKFYTGLRQPSVIDHDADDLFVPASADDAYFIHSGNE